METCDLGIPYLGLGLSLPNPNPRPNPGPDSKPLPEVGNSKITSFHDVTPGN